MRKFEIAIHWLPKVLTMILALLAIIVSFDVFEPGVPAGQIALALLIHLIPAFIIIIALAFSWKKHLRGAILFFILDIVYLISMASRPLANKIVMAVFLLLISVCFLISHSRRAKYERALNKINP